MQNRYVDSSLYRFLSRPKVILFGSQYYYKTDDNESYRLEVHLPNRNKGRRLFAWIGYLIVNPLAFAIHHIHSFADRSNRVSIRNAIIQQNENQKIDKTQLNLLFKSEVTDSYDVLLNTFDKKELELHYRFCSIVKKIKKTEDWNNQEILSEFNATYQEAALNFPIFLIAMHKLMEAENIKTNHLLDDPISQVERLVLQVDGHRSPYNITYYRDDAEKKPIDQRAPLVPLTEGMTRERQQQLLADEDKKLIREKVYSIPDNHILVFRLCYATLIEMYHFAKEKYANAAEFYDKTNCSTSHQWRQGFNTNMKLFNSLFHHETFRHDLAGQDGDERVEKWTRIDTDKDHGSFSPYPATRPTRPGL